MSYFQDYQRPWVAGCNSPEELRCGHLLGMWQTRPVVNAQWKQTWKQFQNFAYVINFLSDYDWNQWVLNLRGQIEQPRIMDQEQNIYHNIYHIIYLLKSDLGCVSVYLCVCVC